MYTFNHNESQKLHISCTDSMLWTNVVLAFSVTWTHKKENCISLPASKISKGFNMWGLIKLSCKFHFGPRHFTKILNLGECDIHENCTLRWICKKFIINNLMIQKYPPWRELEFYFQQIRYNAYLNKYDKRWTQCNTNYLPPSTSTNNRHD
jgi:hypothetical protein